MKIKFIVIGKEESLFHQAISEFEKRISRYINYQKIEIPYLKGTKNLNENEQKEKESREILRYVELADILVILDIKGKEFDSVRFADFLQKQMNASTKQLTFVIGGAYGFSREVYSRADYQISLSKMTFPHQLVRLVFLEQLYRAFSILGGEPYHHE